MRPWLRPVAGGFVVFGAFAGAWSVAAVDIERTFRLTDAQLGLLLAGGILSATCIAAVGGLVIERWTPRGSLIRSLVLWGALLAVQSVAPHLGVFAPVYVVTLAAGGLVDVVLNVLAADALAAEPGNLVRFHGLFNAGAVVGALAAGVTLRLGASWRVVWFAIALVAVLLGVVSRRVEVPALPPNEHPSMLKALGGLRHEGLVVLALFFGASAMVEGGIATWGVLYLRKHLGVGVLAGVGAYVVGEALATATRFSSTSTVGRLGSRRAVVTGATLATAGIVAEALSHNAAVAAIGLAVATVGISVVWPLLLATVNNEARNPVLAIGGVTACGYLGMVAGPPIVGALSDAFGLRVGLLFLAAVAAFVALTPAHVRARRAAPLSRTR